MKINEYPEATELATDDVFIIDSPEKGTRHIPQKNLPWGEGGGGSVPATDPIWVSHRNTYRGKFLGTVFTEDQKAAIANETFDDLYIGDYWTIGNFDWLIADINYWLNTGDLSTNNICTTPHLVIVPKTSLYSAKMNDTAIVTGGYLGSKMYTQGLNNAKTIIYTAFGENNILNHSGIFSNAFSNGVASGGTWVNAKVDLMNQIMVFGSAIFPGSTNPNTIPYNYTVDKTQLSLFKLNPYLIFNSEKSFWLRDIVSSADFAMVSNSGIASRSNSHSSDIGVLPTFGLTGGTA